MGKLILLYDKNNITIEGDTDTAFTEDVGKRYEAYGWHVQHVDNADTDVDAIDAAIEAADVVFMTSSMEAIPQSLKIARATGRIAKQNVAFALVIKALVMVFGLLGLANMWMAVFADTGVAVICILNAIRILYKKL